MPDILTSLEVPDIKIDKYRETHFEYSESRSDAHRSIRIDTELTYDELAALCRKFMGIKR